MKKWNVYLIKENGVIMYVGSTNNFMKRKYEHISKGDKSSIPESTNIKDVELQIVGTFCNKEDAFMHETELMAKYDTIKNGWNKKKSYISDEEWKEWRKQYDKENKEKCLQNAKRYRDSHKVERYEQTRQYIEEHKEWHDEYFRQYRQTEKYKEYHKQYRQAHKDHLLEYQRQYRAKKKAEKKDG